VPHTTTESRCSGTLRKEVEWKKQKNKKTKKKNLGKQKRLGSLASLERCGRKTQPCSKCESEQAKNMDWEEQNVDTKEQTNR
jgi:hypothetical protein